MPFFSSSKVLIILGAAVFGLLLLISNLTAEKMTETPLAVSKTPINLELDVRGGMEMVLEVDLSKLVERALLNERTAINDAFRNAVDRPRVEFVRADDSGTIIARMWTKEDADKALPLIQALSQPIDTNWFGSAKTTRVTRESDRTIRVAIEDEKLENIVNRSVGRSIEMFRCRIDPTGSRDLNFVLEGDKRFLMQIPAVQHIDEVIPPHSGYRSVNLSFHLVNEEDLMSEQAKSVVRPPSHRLGAGNIYYPFAESSGQDGGLIVTERTRITVDCLEDFFDVPATSNNEAGIRFSFDARCAAEFETMTEKNIGKRYAIVLNGEIIASPIIRSAVSDGTGFFKANFTDKSAEDFACRVKAGAFPVKLTIVEERNFPPS